MKASIIYHSVSGYTKAMAQVIAQGMNSVSGMEARTFSLDEIDQDWVKQSQCIIVGTPIYLASLTGELKIWLETTARTLGFAGKLGGAFATERYIHGGGEAGIRTILDHMLCYGMLTYSGGGSKGVPAIHLGPVSVNQYADDCTPTFEIYGQRMAQKTMELFGA